LHDFRFRWLPDQIIGDLEKIAAIFRMYLKNFSGFKFVNIAN